MHRFHFWEDKRFESDIDSYVSKKYIPFLEIDFSSFFKVMQCNFDSNRAFILQFMLLSYHLRVITLISPKRATTFSICFSHFVY